MAIVQMDYLEVVANVADTKGILDYLQKRGVVEIKTLDEVEGLREFEAKSSLSLIGKYRDITQEALKILDKYVPEKSKLTDMLAGLPELKKEKAEKLGEEIDKILSPCYKIIGYEKTIAESKLNIAKLTASRTAIEPWIDFDLPMRYEGTASTKAFIGTFPSEYTKEGLEIALSELLKQEEIPECEIISHTKDRSCVFILALKENAQATETAIRSLGFAYPSDPTKHPPKVRYDRLTSQIEKANLDSEEAKKNITELSDKREEIKFAFDYFSLKFDRYSVLERVSIGDNIIAFSGFIPSREVESLKKEVEEKFTAAVFSSPADEFEDVPALFENNSFVAPVESITKMYSMPGKEDIDPNPVMSIFYYLLFGIMLSDAGYGLLMVLGCGFAKLKYKLKGNIKKTVDLYFYCGLSTVFWGALFGSWFGDTVTRVADQFFEIPNLGEVWNETLGFTLFRENIAIWFEPVNDPTKLLLFSFLFGVIHLFFGVGASFWKMWKVGNKIGAICDCIPVFMLVTGAAPIGANIIKAGTFAPEIANMSKWLALAGLILVILTSGRDSKNIFGKLGLGLYGLYNTASGWLSDILSYSRLLALGLCTGVIATVINTLGTIPENKAVKLLMFTVVFIFGHTVNIAINLIGTYVHTNRLQYVEFFSKFYEGGGRNFTPLKSNTKYFNIKED